VFDILFTVLITSLPAIEEFIAVEEVRARFGLTLTVPEFIEIVIAEFFALLANHTYHLLI